MEQTLRNLEIATRRLHNRVRAGNDFEGTRGTARRIGVLLNDADMWGRRIMTSAFLAERVQPAMKLINEIAPRPHNSGHHSIEANATSQFEQHVRAVCDMPLGDTALKSPAVMVNLVGAEGYQGPVRYEGFNRVLAMPDVYIHLYGKAETRPFRKMGHVTIVRSDVNEAIDIAQQIKEEMQVIA